MSIAVQCYDVQSADDITHALAEMANGAVDALRVGSTEPLGQTERLLLIWRRGKNCQPFILRGNLHLTEG